MCDSSSSAPQPMTTDTTSTTTQGPTFTSGTSNTTASTKIPSWLESTSQSMVQRANTLSQTPYQSYEGQRIAGFDPMMEQAFQRIGGQQVAGQVGQATGLAGAAGERALAAGQYDPYTMGQFTGEAAQQYMSPYMQSVVNAQLGAAQREADIAATGRGAAAARAGAFGGSRQAIMEAEAQRNLASQKSDIQAAGLQKAFEDAQAQFNAEAALREQSRQFGTSAAIQGAGQATGAAQALGSLGQTQFGQQMDITQGLGYAGTLRQAQEQAGLDVAYQDFLAAQKYPYEQLSWLQGITAGAPHSTTQTSSTKTSGVTRPGEQTTKSRATQKPTEVEPNLASQVAGAGLAAYGAYQMGEGGGGAAEGGVVGYAEGGITGLLSDQQLQQRQNNPNLPTIARLAAEMQARENAQIRQASMAQQPMQGPRPTVAEEAAAGLAALPVRDDLVETAAEGGILGWLGNMFGGADVEDLEAARERYRAAGSDTSGIDQALAAARAKGAEDLDTRAETARFERTAPQSAPMQAPVIPQGPERTAVLLNRQGLGALGKPAATVTPVAPSQTAGLTPPPAPAARTTAPAGLAATPEAAAVQPTAAAVPSQDPLAQMLAESRKNQQAALEAQKAALKEYNDAVAADAAKDVAEFEARSKDQDKPFEEKRSRVQKREAELDAQRKEARTFALLRAGLAMMSGESPYALVNIGRGLSVGAEGYAADMAKIDKSREALREQLDQITELQAQMRAATGDKKAELTRAYRKAERDGKYATAKLLSDAGLEASRAETNALFTTVLQAEVKSQAAAQDFQYDLAKIKASGDQSIRVANANAQNRPSSERGAVTQRDLAEERSKAAAEWAKERGVRLQYPDVDDYVTARMRAYLGEPAAATTQSNKAKSKQAPAAPAWTVQEGK